MKRHVNYISIFIIITLIAALAALTACKPKSAPDQATTDKATGQASQGSIKLEQTTTIAPATTVETKKARPENALPTWLCDDLTTLSFLTHAGWSGDSPQPSNDLPKYRELERLTNVHIEFEVIPVGELNAAVDARFASGSKLPDIVNYNAGVSRLPALVEEKLIVDQTKFWNERYPNTHALISGEHPYSDPMYAQLYATMSINGIFYGATQIAPIRGMQTGLLVNKFWLEKLKLPEPKTIDEFYNMLVAFRDNAARLNEDTDAIIPLASEKFCLTVIANYFGVEFGGSANGNGLSATDGKLRFERTGDKYRAFVSFLNKLYKDKLLDPDFMTADRNTLNAYSKNNKCGVINWWIQAMDSFSAYSPYSGEGFNSEIEVFRPLAPLKNGADGGYIYNRRSGLSNMMLISTACKNPEIAADWIDFIFASRDGMDMIAYGVLGESFLMNGGEVEYIKDKDGRWRREAVGGGQQPHAFIEADERYIYATAPKWKIAAWDSLIPYYREGTVYNLALLPDESMALIESCPELSKYIDEAYDSFVTGEADVNDDAAWNEYVETCESLGQAVYVKNYQAAYDRKNKK